MSAWTLLWTLLGCGPAATEGHDHGVDAHGGQEGVAITRWSAGYELFVELDAPVAGRRIAYHAHVTRMADNHPVQAGTLTLRFEQDGFVVESHTDPQVARPGIFAAEATAPPVAGTYALSLIWTDGVERVQWAGAAVVVGATEPVGQLGQPSGEIAFLKESQWQVPFAVAPAQEVALAPAVQASAVVEVAPEDAAVVAAPMGGLLAWTDALPVVGRRVQRGERLAALVPAGAAESWSRLQADVATARIDLELAQQELARVEGLVARERVAARRLQEARAAVERASAELSAKQRRRAALTSERSGAVVIEAPADGLVVAVGAAHGSRVEAGAPIVTVASGARRLLRGRVHDRSQVVLSPVASIAVQRGDWAEPRALAGARVLTEQLVFDPRTLSAPLTVLLEDGAGLSVGDVVALEVGVGAPEPRLAVPRSAVVEVNGQDVVFVQHTGESFSRRRVELGRRDAVNVEVRSGVELGEMVVVEGGFDVHVASLSGALESHRH